MLTLILTLTLQGSLTLTLTLTLTLQGSRIVGFEVEPSSIRHTYSGAWKGGDTSLSTCGGSTGSSPPAMDSAGEVVFTYDVKWEYSAIKWASRWDTYLLMGDEQIHWCARGGSRELRGSRAMPHAHRPTRACTRPPPAARPRPGGP